jgi:hypothetical protein
MPTLQEYIEACEDTAPEDAVIAFYNNDPYWGTYGKADVDDFRRSLEDSYRGAYDSGEDYAEELTSQSFIIPEGLESYIDYKSMWTDMRYEGAWFAHGYVFVPC